MKEFTPPITLKIEPDPDPENPRKAYDNAGHMVCWHRRYDLGDEQPKESPDEFMRELASYAVNFKCHSQEVPEQHIRAVINKYYVTLPLYLHDHSGLSISTGAFNDPWDSGQVGFTFISLKECQDEQPGVDVAAGWDALVTWREGKQITLRDWAKLILEGEVETYDQYLSGDIWGYVIEDKDGEQVDSCWGFYGHEYCEQEGKAMLAAHNLQLQTLQIETQIAECYP